MLGPLIRLALHEQGHFDAPEPEQHPGFEGTAGIRHPLHVRAFHRQPRRGGEIVANGGAIVEQATAHIALDRLERFPLGTRPVFMLGFDKREQP